MIGLNVDLGLLPGILGTMIPIVAIVGGIGLALANRYLKSKERMEMISRGMDVSAFKDHDMAEAIAYGRNRRNRSPLRGGLVAMGAGMGLLISYYLCHTMLQGNEDENAAIYFGVIAMFVGLALIISHLLEKKAPAEDKQ